MKYISTKELAKRWNVSVARILTMTKNGQIHGAVKIGNSWVFHEDVQKPQDKRKKQIEIVDEYYPPVFSNYMKEDEVTNEELRKIIKLERDFFSFKTKGLIDEFVSLGKSTTNTSIKIECLYFLTYCYAVENKYQQCYSTFHQLANIVSSKLSIHPELEILLLDTNTMLFGFSTIKLSYASLMSATKETNPLYVIACSIGVLNEYLYNKKIRINTMPFEAFLISYDLDTNPITNIFLEIQIALMYYINEDIKMGDYHLKRSLKNMEDTKILWPCSFYYHYIANKLKRVKPEISSESLTKIKNTARSSAIALRGLNRYITKKAKYPELTIDDFEYLDYLIHDYKNSYIASIKGISEQAVSNKYQKLYGKFNVNNKNELYKKYIGFIYFE